MMHRILEIILGLERGFLSREGELSVDFNPHWPWQSTVGAGVWNLLLALIAIALVVYVYRREARTRTAKVLLGGLRLALLGLVIALLNRPVLTLGQSRTEPSVLAVMIDDSISMRVRDAGTSEKPQSRMESVVELLSGPQKTWLEDLRKTHIVRLYRFDQDAKPLEGETFASVQPEGQHTQIINSLRTVLADLQGQRLAGVVVLTDGRETPAAPVNDGLAAVKDFGVKIYPIAVGSDRSPSNIDLQSIIVQDSAFKGDIVNVKAMVRGVGYEPNHQVILVLKDKKTGALLAVPGTVPEQKIALPNDQPIEVELQFKPEEIGPLDVIVEAVKQQGEVDDADNVRSAQISVLDAKVAVLYVDGYPRWEYRGLKDEMMRNKTVDISCLLTSADPSFAQEGDKPIRRFPESIEEMLDYDVVIFGDVDPRQFSDAQLQLVADFVSKRGGGFGMVAGPRWSPQSFRNTAIEPILPVNVSLVQTEDTTVGSLTQGFRPQLTKEGAASSIFRFFADKSRNEHFIADEMQPIFWYCHGVMIKPGVGEVYAQHPLDSGPDGRKAPLLVLGRYGAGRTLFSAIDDSWRWRFYTGESVFDTYWVQQIRYLARSKKLGQRRLTFNSMRPAYELGEQVRVTLRILDPQLQQQLPEQIGVELVDAAGQVVGHETLLRQEGQTDLFLGSFPADRVGRFTVKLPPIASGVEAMDLPIEVAVPRLELSQPQVDRTLLSRLASETMGKSVDFALASELPAMIPSAAKVIPVETAKPLWDAPLALAIFVLLITTEWIVRKMYGMV